MSGKEIFDALRGDRIKVVVYSHADPLLAFAHAECTRKLYLVGQIIFVNMILQLFYDLS